MRINRRDFLKISGITAAGFSTLAGFSFQKQKESFDPLNEKGIHPILEKDFPYIFIDSCIVIFLAFIIPLAFRYAIYAIKIKAVASEISMFFVYVSLPLCGLLMAIHYVQNILIDFSKLLSCIKRKNANVT